MKNDIIFLSDPPQMLYTVIATNCTKYAMSIFENKRAFTATPMPSITKAATLNLFVLLCSFVCTVKQYNHVVTRKISFTIKSYLISLN